MPLDILGIFDEAMIHIDIFGLCVSNNLYSILNTVRKLEYTFEKDKIAFLNSKSALLVTKYNSNSRFENDIFTAAKVNEVLTSGICPYFVYDIKTAGFIPYCEEFDAQIEKDVLISDMNEELKDNYNRILIRLIGG